MCTSIYLVATLASKHLASETDYDYNEFNPGIGVGCQLNDRWDLEFGAFRNSFRDVSVFATASWEVPMGTPLGRNDTLSAGLFGGLAWYEDTSRLRIDSFQGVFPVAGFQMTFDLTESTSLRTRVLPKAGRAPILITTQLNFRF